MEGIIGMKVWLKDIPGPAMVIDGYVRPHEWSCSKGAIGR